MSIERTIVNKLRESRKVNESIYNLTNSEITNVVSKVRAKYGRAVKEYDLYDIIEKITGHDEFDLEGVIYALEKANIKIVD